MSIVLIVIIIIAVLYVIGLFAPDDSENNNSNNNNHQSSAPKRTPPPNYRYWNGVEYNGSEIRCDWCAYLRTEKETGRKYCSKYPGYVDVNYVCDSYVNGIEQVAKGLANIILNDKNK